MKLHELKSLLKSHPTKHFRLLLPTGADVPVSFHVTEVGHIQKKFIDCGGTLREAFTCQLQVWVGDDDEHRLEAGKTAMILEKARAFLPDDSVPVEIEYEDEVISQYTIDGHETNDDAVLLLLSHKHTDCLAKEQCGVPDPLNEKSELEDAGSCCSSKPGCC